VCYDRTGDVKLKCGHAFCGVCAKEWFTRNEEATCPMCRGPFVFKGVRAWIEEKNERDMLYEEGFNAIMNHTKRLFTWKVKGRAIHGKQVSKIQKLAEYQKAYNEHVALYGDYMEDWDEEDIGDFALFAPFDFEYLPKITEYVDPTDKWVTKYPKRSSIKNVKGQKRRNGVSR